MAIGIVIKARDSVMTERPYAKAALSTIGSPDASWSSDKALYQKMPDRTRTATKPSISVSVKRANQTPPGSPREPRAPAITRKKRAMSPVNPKTRDMRELQKIPPHYSILIFKLSKPRLSRRGRTHNFRALRLLNPFVVLYAEGVGVGSACG